MKFRKVKKFEGDFAKKAKHDADVFNNLNEEVTMLRKRNSKLEKENKKLKKEVNMFKDRKVVKFVDKLARIVK